MAFWAITASYALLASQPFAHEHFLRPELVPLVAWFARNHQIIGAAVLAIYMAAHFTESGRRGRSPHISAVVVGGLWTVAAAVLFFLPPLAALSPSPMADAAIFAALVPILLLAAVDLSSAPPIDRCTPPARHASDFVACVAGGLVATAISMALGLARGAGPMKDAVAGIVTTALLQGVVFAAVFLCLTAARAIAALAHSRVVEVGTAALLLVGALFVLLWRVVLPSLVTGEARTAAVAGVFAVALAAAIAARGLRVSSTADDSVQRVMGALSPRVVVRSLGWLFLWMGGLGVAAFSIAAASDVADWNFIVSRLGVAVIWLLVLSALVQYVRMPAPGEPVAFFALTGVFLALYVGWTTTAVDRALASTGIERDAALRVWTTRDPAARFLTDGLTPAVATSDTRFGQSS